MARFRIGTRLPLFGAKLDLCLPLSQETMNRTTSSALTHLKNYALLPFGSPGSLPRIPFSTPFLPLLLPRQFPVRIFFLTTSISNLAPSAILSPQLLGPLLLWLKKFSKGPALFLGVFVPCSG